MELCSFMLTTFIVFWGIGPHRSAKGKWNAQIADPGRQPIPFHGRYGQGTGFHMSVVARVYPYTLGIGFGSSLYRFTYSSVHVQQQFPKWTLSYTDPFAPLSSLTVSDLTSMKSGLSGWDEREGPRCRKFSHGPINSDSTKSGRPPMNNCSWKCLIGAVC